MTAQNNYATRIYHAWDNKFCNNKLITTTKRLTTGPHAIMHTQSLKKTGYIILYWIWMTNDVYMVYIIFQKRFLI